MQNEKTKSKLRGGFAPPRPFVFAGLALLATIVCAWAGHGSDAGYLPCIGPAPLRFHAVPPPSTNLFHLPKPTPAPEPPVSQLLPPAPPVVSAATNTPPQPPAIQTNSFPDAAPQDGVVSPQMLLKFFNKGANGPSASVAAPLDFTPPKVAPPASAPAPSKAEYSTTP